MSSSIAGPRQRRRAVLTCVECRKRKQKCDRGLPCAQCVVRGTDSLCKYERYKSRSVGAPITSGPPSPHASESAPAQPSKRRHGVPATSTLLEHAHEYGYSNSESLNSMGMLTQTITDVSAEVPASCPSGPSQLQNRTRLEYYGYVRRLPPIMDCELLIQQYFAHANHFQAALDEIIFREQLEHWWTLAHDLLLKQGPDGLPEEIRCFPALLFQVLAIALQFLPHEYNSQVDRLKFGPLQTIDELSAEYSDCGVALSNLFRRMQPTFIGVQQSYLRDYWLINAGNIMQAWNHSGKTVQDAMAIGLHLEPEVPLSSRPEPLLNVLWMNELRKRTWINLFVWDSSMSLALGRPMFIDLNECTVTVPVDCEVPRNRLRHVPVSRAASDKPTPMTERLLRYEISLRLCEIRELENQGSIPRDPDKVKELHNFAIKFRQSLPSFYRIDNPDTRWDSQCKFLPTHRELLSYLINSFLVSLHRPYIFTRSKSQREVYEASLAILDSQSRHFEAMRTSKSLYYISSTFPTFDAAALLAVVLVSNPERYRESFARPHQSLQKALERLQLMGSVMNLAQVGADILRSTLRRVLEAQQGARHPPQPVPVTHLDVTPQMSPFPTQRGQHRPGGSKFVSTSASPNSDQWQFGTDVSVLGWTTQQPDFSEFDFSNLEVPIPLRELLLDAESSSLLAGDGDLYNSMPAIQNSPSLEPGDSFQRTTTAGQTTIGDGSENSFWNFLANYPATSES